MSSGWGIKGRIGRCYPFYSDFKDCLVSEREKRECVTHVLSLYAHSVHTIVTHPQQNRENDTVSVCLPEKVDYLECLHHKKEYVRVKAMNEQYVKNLTEAAAEAKASRAPDHH